MSSHSPLLLLPFCTVLSRLFIMFSFFSPNNSFFFEVKTWRSLHQHRHIEEEREEVEPLWSYHFVLRRRLLFFFSFHSSLIRSLCLVSLLFHLFFICLFLVVYRRTAQFYKLSTELCPVHSKPLSTLHPWPKWLVNFFSSSLAAYSISQHFYLSCLTQCDGLVVEKLN